MLDRRIILAINELMREPQPIRQAVINARMEKLFNELGGIYDALPQPARAVAYYKLMRDSGMKLPSRLSPAPIILAGWSLVWDVPTKRSDTELLTGSMAGILFTKHVCPFHEAEKQDPALLKAAFDEWIQERREHDMRKTQQAADKHALIIQVLDQHFPGLQDHMMRQPTLTRTGWKSAASQFDKKAGRIAADAMDALADIQEIVNAIVRDQLTKIR